MWIARRRHHFIQQLVLLVALVDAQVEWTAAIVLGCEVHRRREHRWIARVVRGRDAIAIAAGPSWHRIPLGRQHAPESTAVRAEV
jgi:hypothetical protein